MNNSRPARLQRSALESCGGCSMAQRVQHSRGGIRIGRRGAPSPPALPPCPRTHRHPRCDGRYCPLPRPLLWPCRPCSPWGVLGAAWLPWGGGHLGCRGGNPSALLPHSPLWIQRSSCGLRLASAACLRGFRLASCVSTPQKRTPQCAVLRSCSLSAVRVGQSQLKAPAESQVSRAVVAFGEHRAVEGAEEEGQWPVQPDWQSRGRVNPNCDNQGAKPWAWVSLLVSSHGRSQICLQI